MGYLALYRKYRPTDFNDMSGQENVVKIIENAVKQNKVSHAYLFYGPRGTGKTTTAKIIAKIVNCLNQSDGHACGTCENCINVSNNCDDIIEIDAASNNGVDEIRELRDKINLVPASLKYKIYIIDEVHMLSMGAFNALLKTLEEPPSHVIFILATTELHKVPQTIVSRCQKFQFLKLSITNIYDRLKKIVDIEKIKITDDALYEIARIADGGMRDAINLLDQLSAYSMEEISISDVHNINGTVDYDQMLDIILNIVNNNKKELLDSLEYLMVTGKNIVKVVEEFIIYLKDVILFKNSNMSFEIKEKNETIKQIAEIVDNDFLFRLINKLNDVDNSIKFSTYPLILFEICLLEFTNYYKKDEKSEVEIEPVKRPIKSIKNETVDNPKKEKVDIKEEKSVNKDAIDSDKCNVDIRINNTFVSANKNILNNIKENWKKIEQFLLDKKLGVIAGMLNDCGVVAASDKNIILVSKYEGVSDRINHNYVEVTDLLYKIFDKKYDVVAISEDIWNVEKKKYVDNIKNGYKYEYISEEMNVSQNNENKTEINELINILGNDIIEYK